VLVNLEVTYWLVFEDLELLIKLRFYILSCVSVLVFVDDDDGNLELLTKLNITYWLDLVILFADEDDDDDDRDLELIVNLNITYSSISCMDSWYNTAIVIIILILWFTYINLISSQVCFL